jgi:hypothetical protein
MGPLWSHFSAVNHVALWSKNTPLFGLGTRYYSPTQLHDFTLIFEAGFRKSKLFRPSVQTCTFGNNVERKFPSPSADGNYNF